MITLRYVNSTTRVTVHELQLSDILEKEDSIAYVLHCFQDAGYHTATDPAQLFIKPHAGELKKLICTDVILDNSTISYSEVIPPYGAYRVDRVNGIRYFFNTSEKEHENYPHIHAAYQKEEISIYFRDFHVINRMKSPSKQKEAVAYVKEHIDKLQAKWDDIMNHDEK